MRKLLTGIMVAGSVALSTPAALADSLEYLTEVEVSLWEIVSATMFSQVDSEASGEILGGRIPDTTAIDEYKKQLEDVATHWAAFKTKAPANMEKSMSDFESAYADFLEHSNSLVAAKTEDDAKAAAIRAYRAAQLADDILDSQLKSKLR